LTGSSDRLSTVSAAHQSRASQRRPWNCFTQPGGWNRRSVKAVPGSIPDPERAHIGITCRSDRAPTPATGTLRGTIEPMICTHAEVSRVEPVRQ
jgi:hypothetical protein